MEQANTSKITTTFNEDIFNFLPEILKTSCNLFKNPIEKEVFLASALGTLSGCIPNIFGVYDTHRVGCNLYIFILSPAGTGKGSAMYSRILVQPIHAKKRQESADDTIEYRKLLNEYNFNKKKNKGQENDPPPEFPKQKMHFIPANSSASAFLDALNSNDGRGSLFCTEADTLNGALKQDWGNYSDIMRCAFHHEPATQLRKTNNEFIEITKPHVSIVLSGTPGQLVKLIPNTENGLFSRFCYYELKLSLEWKDIFAESGIDYEKFFLEQGEKIGKLYDKLNELEQPILFRFTKDQEQVFNNNFEKWQIELAGMYGNEIIPSVRRLGLINFRIAMLLSSLRLVDVPELPTEIVCNSTDYYTAGLITEAFKNNAMSVFKHLASNTCQSIFDNDRKNKLYQSLPEKFSRDEAVPIAEGLGFSTSTIDRLLKSNELFQKTAYGVYEKIK